MTHNSTTPTQWELFAQNMSDDLDRINERLYKIFNVQPPKTARHGERASVRGPHSPRKTNTSARFRRREQAYPYKTQQEIIAEIRQNDSDVPKTNYNALPVRNSQTPARIFRPKIIQNLPYSNQRDITPVITGDTVNSGRQNYHTHNCENCDHDGHCSDCDCQECNHN